jgi:hypothetical protein
MAVWRRPPGAGRWIDSWGAERTQDYAEPTCNLLVAL